MYGATNIMEHKLKWSGLATRVTPRSSEHFVNVGAKGVHNNACLQPQPCCTTILHVYRFSNLCFLLIVGTWKFRSGHLWNPRPHPWFPLGTIQSAHVVISTLQLYCSFVQQMRYGAVAFQIAFPLNLQLWCPFQILLTKYCWCHFLLRSLSQAS